MDIDKRTVLAFVIIGIIIIIFQTDVFQKKFFPRQFEANRLKKEKRLKEFEQSQLRKDSLVVASKHKEQPALLKNQIGSKAEEKSISNKLDVFSQYNEAEEKLIKIETSLIKGILSTRGANIISWKLKKYKSWDDKIVDMIPEKAMGVLGVSFSITDTTFDTSSLVFQCKTDSILVFGDEQKSIEFVLDLGNNKRIYKKYTFFNNRYDFGLEVKLQNMGDVISGRNYSIGWKAGLASTEKRLSDDMYYAKVYVSTAGSTHKRKSTDGKVHVESGSSIDWTALRSKYFVAAISPKDRKGLEVEWKGELVPTGNKKAKWKKFSFDLHMPFLNDDMEKDSYLVYCGPLDYETIKGYNLGFENMMDFGWKIIEPFSKAVLWSLKKIHVVVPNYGLVLIIFSLLIKIIVYPLTHKSFQSMQRMQALQPKIAELKEKYGKDPQKLNKETMKLYKDFGVNPLGGCLPMLLQMPLLYSLFIIFRATIELRGEKFVWWIKSLSSPDTIATLPFTVPIYGDSVNVLPLLMGATMFFQQKMSVQDPKQKMMAYFMPIFFTLLFNNFPSGLTLYYTLFNVLTIAQQKLITDKNKISPDDLLEDKKQKGTSLKRKNK